MIDVVSVAACLLSIAGKICVNNKSRWNFAFFIAGYVLWIAYNLLNTPNVPQVAMYVVYTALSVQGWIKWKGNEHHEEDKMPLR